jgi:hypothetical protein
MPSLAILQFLGGVTWDTRSERRFMAIGGTNRAAPFAPIGHWLAHERSCQGYAFVALVAGGLAGPATEADKRPLEMPFRAARYNDHFAIELNTGRLWQMPVV